MNIIVKNSIRCVLFILVQVYVLFAIRPLHQFVTPYLYFLFILWLPYNTPRYALTLIGFVYGFVLDVFLHTPGLHASACTLVAYLRPFLINILIQKHGSERNYQSPSIKSMGWGTYIVFVLLLAFVHHFWLVLLEWLQFGNFLYFLGKVAATTAVSFLLIMVTELLFFRKEKFITNT
jgi:rod shape-determining protein MreD